MSTTSAHNNNQVQAAAVVSQPQTRSSSNTDLSFSSLIQRGSPVLGNPAAPITIVEFGDFQWDFCDRFAKETEPQINQTYIQTGKVNMVFKHFPFCGLDSKPAALASQCANEKGRFRNYYEILYNNQGQIDSGWASKDNLKKFAAQLPGLNTLKFNSCLDNEKYKSLLQNDVNLANTLGVRDLPYFIIVRHDGSNAVILAGAFPFPSFQDVIDKELVGVGQD